MRTYEDILLAPFVSAWPSMVQVCRNVFGKTRSTFESQNQRLRGVKSQEPHQPSVDSATRNGKTWDLGGCWDNNGYQVMNMI